MKLGTARTRARRLLTDAKNTGSEMAIPGLEAWRPLLDQSYDSTHRIHDEQLAFVLHRMARMKSDKSLSC